MKIEQVMLTLVAVMSWGCTLQKAQNHAEPLPSAYAVRRVWAVAPLRNESGSLHADGLNFADQLARSLENAPNVDVMPVNRTLAAMEALKMPALRTSADVLQVLKTMGADALVVGTITAYDPYDPPKFGVQLELFEAPPRQSHQSMDLRKLSSASTGSGSSMTMPKPPTPVSAASVYLDASDPQVREELKRYAYQRGADAKSPSGLKRWTTDYGVTPPDHEGWHIYRISMDLYSEFASYIVSRQLMQAEQHRLGTAALAQSNSSP